ncbi:MAG: hypothetical protein IJI66_13925 [Erysipelotrichaceae bacterium]|nr:hypothetical protein [Erysipelotrichaceae bacterium]
MKVNSKSFNIDLTEDEISIIIDALNEDYKTFKNMDEKGEIATRHMNKARELRNTLGGLINRLFMGEDA